MPADTLKNMPFYSAFRVFILKFGLQSTMHGMCVSLKHLCIGHCWKYYKISFMYFRDEYEWGIIPPRS